MQTRIQVVNEAQYSFENGWKLCLQHCRYVYNDGNLEEGYRFIWRDPTGKLVAHRGQARIPSLDIALKLINEAIRAGWGSKVFN